MIKSLNLSSPRIDTCLYSCFMPNYTVTLALIYMLYTLAVQVVHVTSLIY